MTALESRNRTGVHDLHQPAPDAGRHGAYRGGVPQPAERWTAPVRSLAGDLRRRTQDEIAELLTARPDLTRPPAADLTAVAARACTRAAVYRALDELDTGRLTTFQAMALTGDPVRSEAAASLAATSVTRIDADREGLWRTALAWRSDDGYHLVRQAVEALGPHPAGLAPAHPDDASGLTAQAAADVDALRATLDAAPPPGRAIVDRLLWGPPVAVVDAGGRTGAAVDNLLAHGILRRGEAPGQVILPRPVALALRGGRIIADPAGLDEPVPRTTPAPPDAVAAGAGVAAATLLDQLDELAERWGADPPRVLRNRGVAVRDLRALAAALEAPEPQAAFLIEVGYAAGLLDDDGEHEPVWAPTRAYDDWLTLPSARRWLTLVRAWLSTTRAPHVIGRGAAEPPPSGKAVRPPAINALSADVVAPPIRALRTELLADLAAIPAGSAADLDDLVTRVLWRHPLRAAEPLRQAAHGVLREAAWLGLTSGGALAPPGHALVTARGADEADLLEAVEPVVEVHLPAPVERILLQADLTAVAPGRLEGSAARFLRLAADVESRGGATVYRFSPASIRRCLDAGWSADQVLSALTDLAGGPDAPMPQPLSYLVTDTARRHGQTRVGATTSYLRSDDSPGLDELFADRRLGALRLRRLAPGVLISPSAVTTVVSMLRSHGYAPLTEDPQGAVVLTPRDHRRSPGRRRSGWSLTPPGYAAASGYAARPGNAGPAGSRRSAPPDDTGAASRLAGELIAAEATREAGPGAAGRDADDAVHDADVPQSDPVVTLVLLREAASARRAVRIGVSDATGRVRAVDLIPERVTSGRLDAVDIAYCGPLTFSLSRVTGARPL